MTVFEPDFKKGPMTDTFVVEPDVDDANIVFQERGVPRRRMHESVHLHPTTAAPLTTIVPPSSPEPPSAPATPSAPTPPHPVPSFRSTIRSVDTLRWLSEATNHLVTSLLRREVPRETASMWAGVVGADVGPLIERHVQRERRASEALQATIEASHVERAKELADERNLRMSEAHVSTDEIDAAAASCAEAVQSAAHRGLALRSRIVTEHRTIDDVHQSLASMAHKQPAYRSWLPRIQSILDEEADVAHSNVHQQSEQTLADVRRCSTIVPLSKRASTPSTTHLQTIVDAIETIAKLRAVRTLQNAAAETLPLLASCEACVSERERCKECKTHETR